MNTIDHLSDVLNNLVDLSSQGHNEDAAFILAAIIDDIRERDALDELEWILTSLRDTNLDSTSCLVLAAMIFTKDFPSKKRRILWDWYHAWLIDNRDEQTVRDLSLIAGGHDEDSTAPSTSRPISSDQD